MADVEANGKKSLEKPSSVGRILDVCYMCTQTSQVVRDMRAAPTRVRAAVTSVGIFGVRTVCWKP